MTLVKRIFPFYEERALSSIPCHYSWLHPRARATSFRWESESLLQSCSSLQNNKRSIMLIAVACQLLWGLEQEVASYIVTQFIFICWNEHTCVAPACAVTPSVCTIHWHARGFAQSCIYRFPVVGFKKKKNCSSTDTQRLLFTLWVFQKIWRTSLGWMLQISFPA